MRVRNLKNKVEILTSSSYYIKSPIEYKGKWNKLFKNNNPIHIEIGTGKCKFIYEKALKNPDINFIGIERIDTVLAIGIKELKEKEKLTNLFLINYDAEKIDDLFIKEIDQIYLNFSDPWPKKRHEKRRLTSFNFLSKYDIIFKGEKLIEFKTDNEDLFLYSIVSLTNYGYKIVDISLDLHKKTDFDNIVTEYENKFSNKGFKIKYLKAVKSI